MSNYVFKLDVVTVSGPLLLAQRSEDLFEFVRNATLGTTAGSTAEECNGTTKS